MQMNKTIIDLDSKEYKFSIESDIAFDECRNKYNSMITEISKNFIGNLYWGVGSIASRNKYNSPLIDRCTKLILIKNYINSNLHIDVVKTKDRVLHNLLKDNFPLIKIECTESLLERIRRITRPPRQYFVSVLMLSLRFLASRDIKKQINFNSRPNIPIVLLDTFILNNNGDEGGIQEGVYKDRYYPGLLESLSEEEAKAVWYVPTPVGFYSFYAIYKKMRQAKSQLLVLDDFLKFSDYLFALLFPVKYLRCKIGRVQFDGVDISALVKSEQLNKSCDYLSIQSILHYLFSKRIKERGVLVSSYIDWNENQPIDKAAIKGFRDFYCEVRIIGYQGYIISKKLHLYCYPTESEIDSGFIPDIMYVVGEALVSDMTEFTTRLDVKVGPAFRFQKVWQSPKFTPNNSHFNILIGLPISLGEAIHIINLVKLATDNFATEGIIYRIKPHPTISIEKIQSKLNIENNKNIEFVLGDFHDALEKSDLLISNSSSICLEGIAKGVPVIVIGSAFGITQNPIPANIATDMWRLAHKAATLNNAIKEYRAHNQVNRQAFKLISKKVAKDYFNPIEKNEVKKFIFGS